MINLEITMGTHGCEESAAKDNESTDHGEIAGNQHAIEHFGKDYGVRAAADEQLDEERSSKESHADKRCDLNLDLLKGREKHQQDSTCNDDEKRED